MSEPTNENSSPTRVSPKRKAVKVVVILLVSILTIVLTPFLLVGGSILMFNIEQRVAANKGMEVVQSLAKETSIDGENLKKESSYRAILASAWHSNQSYVTASLPKEDSSIIFNNIASPDWEYLSGLQDTIDGGNRNYNFTSEECLAALANIPDGYTMTCNYRYNGEMKVEISSDSTSHKYYIFITL